MVNEPSYPNSARPRGSALVGENQAQAQWVESKTMSPQTLSILFPFFIPTEVQFGSSLSTCRTPIGFAERDTCSTQTIGFHDKAQIAHKR